MSSGHFKPVRMHAWRAYLYSLALPACRPAGVQTACRSGVRTASLRRGCLGEVGMLGAALAPAAVALAIEHATHRLTRRSDPRPRTGIAVLARQGPLTLTRSVGADYSITLHRPLHIVPTSRRSNVLLPTALWSGWVPWRTAPPSTGSRVAGRLTASGRRASCASCVLSALWCVCVLTPGALRGRRGPPLCRRGWRQTCGCGGSARRSGPCPSL